jgi:hypothetical protein
LENSEFNSELSQNRRSAAPSRAAISKACGEIPYAAEQASQIAVAGK